MKKDARMLVRLMHREAQDIMGFVPDLEELIEFTYAELNHKDFWMNEARKNGFVIENWVEVEEEMDNLIGEIYGDAIDNFEWYIDSIKDVMLDSRQQTRRRC